MAEGRDIKMSPAVVTQAKQKWKAGGPFSFGNWQYMLLNMYVTYAFIHD